MDGSGSSIVVASVGGQVLPATDSETVPSLLWFAAIQGIESKQDPTGLAQQGCIIPVEAIERRPHAHRGSSGITLLAGKFSA